VVYYECLKIFRLVEGFKNFIVGAPFSNRSKKRVLTNIYEEE